MSRTYTYSFEDTTININHPQFGNYSAYGSGIGTVTVSYTNDISAHDVASDLTVVVSKIAKMNGTVTFNILQSSDFNNYLKKLVAYLKQAPTSEWALTTINIENKSTGDTYVCSGASPQKIPDNSYTDQAGTRDWVWLVANISYE